MTYERWERIREEWQRLETDSKKDWCKRELKRICEDCQSHWCEHHPEHGGRDR